MKKILLTAAAIAAMSLTSCEDMLAPESDMVMYEEDNKSLFMAGNAEYEKNEFHWEQHWGNIKEYYDEYDHPIWKNMPEGGIPGGHDGIDYFEFCAVARAIKENRMGPVDIYDAVTWMAVSALSEESIKKGGAPVEFPDFTIEELGQIFRQQAKKAKCPLKFAKAYPEASWTVVSRENYVGFINGEL